MIRDWKEGEIQDPSDRATRHFVIANDLPLLINAPYIVCMEKLKQ